MAHPFHELVERMQNVSKRITAEEITEHVAVQVNVTGEAEGIFYMEIAGGVLNVEPYSYHDHDALLCADGADLLALADGTLTVEKALEQQKLSFDGNIDKLLMLAAVLSKLETSSVVEKENTEPSVATVAEETVPTKAKKKRRTSAEMEAIRSVKAITPTKRGRKPRAVLEAEKILEEYAVSCVNGTKRGRKPKDVKEAELVIQNYVKSLEEEA